MSAGEKKPVTQETAAPARPTPPSQPVQRQTAKVAEPAKKPLISRRTFLKATVAASTVLAGASMASSGQMLSPLIPPRKGPTIINKADNITTSQFFSWPWEESVSPYYRNIVVRLPDDLVPNLSDPLSRFVAFNTTCVHLRCLVNYEEGVRRLLCPCHGSQYRMPDAVPVAGPAKELNLKPLPQIILALDSDNNLVATELIGRVGIGRDL